MRKNRFDPDDENHLAVRANPGAWTRVSRRAAGLRSPVHAERMREFYSGNLVLPRAVRRLMREPLKSQARLARKRTKVNRLLARYGVRT